MKKRLLTFALALTLLVGLMPDAFAASREAERAAEILYSIHLFRGTGTRTDGTPVFELERTMKRAEGVTMLVRLLGKEAEAEAGDWETPFTDADGWEKPYAGYAFVNGLTAGTEDGTTFCGGLTVDAAQYLTFVLRALGYESGADFAWDAPWELSESLGLSNGEYGASSVFTRGDAAIVSLRALACACRGGEETLADRLIADGVFTEAEYDAARSAPEVPADPYDAVKNYWRPDQLTQAWGPDKPVEHLFFHPIIAYPQWAFHDCNASQSQRYGLDDWMVTEGEYLKILRSVYEKGYILVAMEDVWSEYTTASGQTRMRRNTLMLPEGKKPLIISFDDVNYYPYMLEEGFTSRLVVGDDGEIGAACTDPYTKATFLTKQHDATPILDTFVYEHPDFSLGGAKAIFSLTGYQGILGYRTPHDRDIKADDPRRPAFEAYRAAEIEAVKPVIARLKETGWTFGSHTWGHIRLDTKPYQTVVNDTLRWAEEVGSLVGPTQILFYPHGARPDGDDWHKTGEKLRYLQSQGFRVFASVGVNSFSYCKTDLSAVICDRLHPDGTTLRHSRSRYLQFYDAKDILDTAVRPPLGTDW